MAMVRPSWRACSFRSLSRLPRAAGPQSRAAGPSAAAAPLDGKRDQVRQLKVELDRLAAGRVLSVLRWFHLGCRPATCVLVVDLHHFFSGRLVTRLRLGGRLRIYRFPLSSPHHPNRTTPAKLSA